MLVKERARGITNEGGYLLTFGQGSTGKLGHGTEANEPLPRIVETSQRIRVIQVAAGANHTAMVTALGDVYTFGSGATGQLGHGSRR